MKPNSTGEVPDVNPKNKGGRPALAAPPLTAAGTRALIAVEIVKTTPNATKLRHLQKLLKSQQQAEEHAEVQAAALRKNELLAEANELRRAEYQRRYQVGQQRKAPSNEALRADTHVTTQLTAENNTLRETIASLRGELARVKDGFTRLKDERDTLMQERDALQATVKNLQPQADALARIKSDVLGELNCLFNADEKVMSLQADLESLKKEERTMTVLERMKEILFQLKTLRHAYRVGEEVI
jgi:chromosome segregation ATPase